MRMMGGVHHQIFAVGEVEVDTRLEDMEEVDPMCAGEVATEEEACQWGR